MLALSGHLVTLAAVALLGAAGCGSFTLGYLDRELAVCWPDCEEAPPVYSGWSGVGGSELCAWGELCTWGSASGGGLSNSVGLSRYPVAVVDASGNPAVAWYEIGPAIDALRFDGQAWVEVSPGSASGQGLTSGLAHATSVELLLDGQGRLVMAWTQGRVVGNAVKDARVYVQRLEGSRWIEVSPGSAAGGGISDAPYNANGPSLAEDGQGRLLAAWRQAQSEDINGSHDVYLRRLDGSAWQELDGSGSSGGLSASPASSGAPLVAADSQGRVVVTWTEPVGEGRSQIYARRFDGARWGEVGAGSASGNGVSQSPTSAKTPALALQRDGEPVIAWSDSEATADLDSNIYIKRYDGSAWVEVGPGSAASGGISHSAGTAQEPSLVLDAQDRPIVAWSDIPISQYQSHVYVKRYDGSAWVEVGAGSASDGGLDATIGASFSPRLARGSAGHLVLTWADENYFTAGYYTNVYLRRFDGQAWRELGQGNARGGGLSDTAAMSTSPALALGPGGDMLVTWQENAAPGQSVYARVYDGQAWVEPVPGAEGGCGLSGCGDVRSSPQVLWSRAGWLIALASNSGAEGPRVDVYLLRGGALERLGGQPASAAVFEHLSHTSSTALALDQAERPLLAFEAGTNPLNDVFVVRYEAGAWVPLGVSSVAGLSQTENHSTAPALAVDAEDRPVVAWVEDLGMDGAFRRTEVYARRFEGGTWNTMGPGSASGEGISQGPARAVGRGLAVDGQGRVVVAWMEDLEAGRQVYVRAFDGAAWAELGAGSASGLGVSQSRGEARSFSLAVDGTGAPLLAWDDTANGHGDIYLRRFDGSRWKELTPGSATGGGVSNSAVRSTAPALAARGDRVCVAWEELGDSVSQILLRCAR